MKHSPTENVSRSSLIGTLALPFRAALLAAMLEACSSQVVTPTSPICTVPESNAPGYISGLTSEGDIICSPLPTVASDSSCPYVSRRGDRLFFENYTPEQALTRRYPRGCLPILENFLRPCTELRLSYSRVYLAADAGVPADTTIFTDPSGPRYFLRSPAELVWDPLNTPECRTGPAPIDITDASSVINPIDTSTSPSLIPPHDCVVDRDTPYEAFGNRNDAGACVPLPGQLCNSSFDLPGYRGYYDENGNCEVRWGPVCDAGTTTASHIALDGACVPNPGKPCTIDGGTVGQFIPDGSCAGIQDAGVTMDGR